MQQHLKNILKTCNLSPSLHKYGNTFSPRWLKKILSFISYELGHLMERELQKKRWGSVLHIKKNWSWRTHAHWTWTLNTCKVTRGSPEGSCWTGCLCMYVHGSVCAYVCNYVLHMHAQISTMGTCALYVCMCAGVYAHKQVNTNSAYHIQDSAVSCGTRYSDALSHWVVTTTLET